MSALIGVLTRVLTCTCTRPRPRPRHDQTLRTEPDT